MHEFLEDIGRHCANGGIKNMKQYKGDLNGYLKDIKEFVEKFDHNEEKGTFTKLGKKNNSCFCLFVNTSKMPKKKF